MACYLVMLGLPGAGKGTQAKLLAERLGLLHLSTGDLFRDHIRRQTELGQQVQEILRKGGLVSDDITIAMVRDRLQQPDCTAGVVFDGFPRTVAQADALSALLASLGGSIALVPMISVRDGVVVERLTARRTDKRDGKIYHLIFNPPPADALPYLEHRADDQEATVLKRLAEYHANTAPLIAYYENAQVLRVFDGEQPIDVLAAALEAAVRAL